MNSDSKRPRPVRRLMLAGAAGALAAGGLLAMHSGTAAGPVHLTAAQAAPAAAPAAPAPVVPGGATTPTAPEAPDSTTPETVEPTTPETTTGAETPGAPSDGPGGYADTNVDAQTEQTGNN